MSLIENYKTEIAVGQVFALNEFVGFNDKSKCSLPHLYPNQFKMASPSNINKKEKTNYKDFDQLIDSLGICVKDNLFDLIVIDIDGNDYHVFDAMTKYHSKVIMIEFNPTIPNNIIYVQSRDMSIQRGSSLLAIIELARHKGYELVSTTTYNAIFVKRHYFENVLKQRMPSPDNSIYKMHDVPMRTQMFQLYDGTIKIAGCKKLIWHKIKINEEKLQMIPRDKRKFPFAPITKTSFDESDDNEKTQKSVKRRKKKQKKIKHSASPTVILLKATTFVALGFVLGCIYQRRRESN